MFVVQVEGRFSKKNEEFFINKEGKKTRFLSQAQTFRTEQEGTTAGQQFVDSGKGYGFSVDPA